MGVRDDELDAAQAASCEFTQERSPERLTLGRTDIHAENLASAIAVDADRNNHRDRDTAAVLAHLHVGSVDPVALDRTGEERFYFVIELLALS
jgi:hypothetical protein